MTCLGRFRRSLCILLGICLSAACLFGALSVSEPVPVEADRTLTDVNEDIKECEALLSRLERELADVKEQIASDKSNSADALAQAILAQNEQALLETQVELTKSLLESCAMQRATVQAELYLVRDEQRYYEELFAELMRFVYENGETSAFELLFSSSSLSDYLAKRDNFNSIMECVSDLKLSITQSRLKLEKLSADYDDAESRYDRHLAALDEKEDALAETIRTLEELRAGLDADQLERLEKSDALSEDIKTAKATLKRLKEERQHLINKELTENTEGHPDFDRIDPVSGFVWPLDSTVKNYTIADYFGTSGSGDESHPGLDIVCAKGTAILAARAGTVVKAEWYGGYGNCVMIYHGTDAEGNGITTLYGHASKLNCKQGDTVKLGDIIAYVGATGRSNVGNHLHFSVLLNNQYVNPDDYLPDGFYTKKKSGK